MHKMSGYISGRNISPDLRTGYLGRPHIWGHSQRLSSRNIRTESGRMNRLAAQIFPTLAANKKKAAKRRFCLRDCREIKVGCGGRI